MRTEQLGTARAARELLTGRERAEANTRIGTYCRETWAAEAENAR